MSKKLSLILGLAFLCCTLGKAQTVYITEQGNGDGSTWLNASADLRSALEDATAGTEIWVAKGVYRPSDCSDCSTADKEIAFKLKEGVSLLGGFNGTESVMTDRNPALYPTILEGDIGLPAEMSDNSFTILEIGSVTNALIDGFILQNGNASVGVGDDLGTTNSGGAIHIAANGTGNFSSPTINNCIFKNNRADAFGGAIHVYGGFGGHGQAQITNCRFEGNFAPKKGGAIFQYAAFDGTIEGTISNCLFSQNASTEGGAMYVLSSGNGIADLDILQTSFENNWSVSEGGALMNHAAGGQNNSQFTDCTFYNNSGEYGGGIYNDGRFGGNCSPTFLRCVFKANTADNGGAGIYNNGYQGIVNPYFNNCSFELNYTQQSGGALFNNGVEGSCSPVFERCYFLENVVEMYGGAMYNFGKTGQSSPEITNCLFRRNKADSGGSVYNYGGQNGSSSPNIINSTFTLNEARVGPCVYNQGSDSTGEVKPLISNCIFWNNEAYSGFGLVFQNGFAQPTIQHSLIPFDSCEQLNTDPDSDVICGNGLLFNVDPLFTDEANLNFRPLENSPIVDVGILPTGMNLEIDLDGSPRINSVLDLGPYEYGTLAAPSVITQSASGIYCPGDSIALEINAAGQGALNYQWFKDNSSLAGETGNMLVLPDLEELNQGDYTCEVSLATMTVTSAVIHISLHQPNETIIDLDPSATQYCAGENQISVEVQITNGGYFPDIAWVLNEEIVSTEFTPFLFAAEDGDKLYATYNAFQLCYTADDFTSESITFTEEQMVSPQINLILDAETYCEGDQVIAVVDTENAGDNPTINWFNNGALVLSGSNDQFSSDMLEHGDMLSAQLISSLSCVNNPAVDSEVETLNIVATSFPMMAIASENDSLCLNDILSFTANYSDAGNDPDLVWLIDGATELGNGNEIDFAFSESGSHTISALLTADLLCPNEAVISAILDVDIVDCTPNATSEIYQDKLKIWPNPSSSTVHVTWDLPGHKAISYELIDASGRPIRHQILDLNQPESELELDAKTLKEGCYFLKIQFDFFALVESIFIMK